MKNIIQTILLTFAAFFLVKTSTAQTFAIGPKVAFSASSFRGDDISSKKFRKGFQAGAFFSFTPKEWFTVSPEGLFDQRGSQEVLFNNINREIKVNYLTIPVALDFRIPLDGTFYPKFIAGPYASFALNEKQRIYSDDISVVFEETDVNRIDFGGFVGAGLDIESDRIRFSTDLRYLFGSVDVSKEDNLEFRNTQILWSVALGFKF